MDKIKCIFAVIASLSFIILQPSYAANKPNILLIISDDAGYHDFGFHGSQTMKTPSLDQLASEGVLFKQAYVTAAVCGPSRAGLLTGKYQQRFGFEENNVPGYMSKSGKTGLEMGLPLTEKTIANYLKELGYTTSLIGKWHQGDHDDYHPLKRGFDHFYGFRTGARSYFSYSPEELAHRENEKMEKGFRNFEEHQGYLTDRLAEATNKFIQQSVTANQPFFSILSLTAVHAPMQAKPEHLAEFPNLTGKRKILAAMTLAMDEAIASVLAQLKELSIDNNTIVIFVNDNGGPTDQNLSNNFPLSGTKANHLEGGIRVPMLIKWPQELRAGTQFNLPVSTLDLLPTLLAVAENTSTVNELDGVNLLPYIRAENNQRPHETLYWKKENRAAIRHQDWKLLRFPDRPAELYDLSQDISEQQNLAYKYPDIVKNLYKKLFAWELTLERPLWQLKREFEGAAMIRMDTFRHHQND